MKLARLNFVTGKGGTGKSTMAAALALTLGRRGRCVLADLDGRQTAARTLGLSAAAGASPATENIRPIPLSSRAELESFITRVVPLRSLARRMIQSRTFGYVSAAVPGLEGFLMLERLRLLAGEAALGDYYAVVDAPSSGNALELLSVAGGVKRLAPAGTLNHLAAGIAGLLTDPNRFGVILTLTAEELAVREAIETARRLREELHIERITALLNCAIDPLFEPAELRAIRGLGAHAELARRRVDLARKAERAKTVLAETANVEVVELPMLFRSSLSERELITLACTLEAALTPS